MTGPAVSQQLRRIEAEANARVVVPAGRGVRLTNEGRVLAGYAAQVAALMVQAENDLDPGGELVGRIAVGALASTLRSTLAEELAGFQRHHPRVELRIEDGETIQHLDSLADGRLDLVLAESWSPSPLVLPAGVTARSMVSESVWVALPERHRLSRKKQTDLVDLASEVWATCAAGSDEHRALTQTSRMAGIELDIRHFLADQETKLAFVRAGLAVACIPAAIPKPETPGVVYRPLVPKVHRNIVLLTSTRAQPRSVAALIEHILDPGRVNRERQVLALSAQARE